MILIPESGCVVVKSQSHPGNAGPHHWHQGTWADQCSDHLTDRRQNLIRAARVYPNPDFRPLLETSNADDLEWFLEQIDAQIRETPNWVDDRASLREILARLRAKRTAVAGALANRRTAEKLTDPRTARRRVNIKMILLGAGILIAFFALLVVSFK